MAMLANPSYNKRQADRRPLFLIPSQKGIKRDCDTLHYKDTNNGEKGFIRAYVYSPSRHLA